ncbi:hypothetical protein SteCoe_2548 [Stentor coeruleus]|uniref:Uncharacterized protein n=1 Tax=Stentor coeruleus TaxID=5963 RepID=A0A1R2CZC3_9CILI|nr:hypothetical protein SteCoe_9089 [Stentor coeruleus]OMJ94345.1 hypothetical protein SteCoe_2548 [Stentor coeruleus]
MNIIQKKESIDIKNSEPHILVAKVSKRNFIQSKEKHFPTLNSNYQIKSKSNSPEKLPKIKKSCELFEETNHQVGSFLHSKRINTFQAYQFYQNSYAKMLDTFKRRKRESNKSQLAYANCPSPELYREIKEILKFPSYPKRDASPFRQNLCKVMNNSNTIEELLKMTKFKVSTILKSSETNTGSQISPLREYRLSSPIRGNYMII